MPFVSDLAQRTLFRCFYSTCERADWTFLYDRSMAATGMERTLTLEVLKYCYIQQETKGFFNLRSSLMS